MRKQKKNLVNLFCIHILTVGWCPAALMVVESVATQRQMVLNCDSVGSSGGSRGYMRLLVVVVEGTGQ
jgi:hypothetical protein